MDLSLLEKFVVGNTVIVTNSTPASIFEGLRTYGLAGCVQKIDYKAGVCVQLFVSRIFRPCFWYQPSCLEIDQKLRAFEPPGYLFIQSTLDGGPRQVTLQNNSIITGALRSWLVSKSQSRPGQSLYVFISKMTWEETIVIYQGDESMFVTWLKANDTRVRRPQLIESQEDAFGLKVPLSARRPKIGG